MTPTRKSQNSVRICQKSSGVCRIHRKYFLNMIRILIDTLTHGLCIIKIWILIWHLLIVIWNEHHVSLNAFWNENVTILSQIQQNSYILLKNITFGHRKVFNEQEILWQITIMKCNTVLLLLVMENR